MQKIALNTGRNASAAKCSEASAASAAKDSLPRTTSATTKSDEEGEQECAKLEPMDCENIPADVLGHGNKDISRHSGSTVSSVGKHTQKHARRAKPWVPSGSSSLSFHHHVDNKKGRLIETIDVDEEETAGVLLWKISKDQQNTHAAHHTQGKKVAKYRMRIRRMIGTSPHSQQRCRARAVWKLSLCL